MRPFQDGTVGVDLFWNSSSNPIIPIHKPGEPGRELIFLGW